MEGIPSDMSGSCLLLQVAAVFLPYREINKTARVSVRFPSYIILCVHPNTPQHQGFIKLTPSHQFYCSSVLGTNNLIKMQRHLSIANMPSWPDSQ